MKLSEIKLSTTFTVIIVMLIAAVFLLPALGMNFIFWLSNSQDQAYYRALQEQMQARRTSVELSLTRLRLRDAALFNCVQAAAREQASIPPGNSGGIDSVVDLPWLNCPDSGISQLDGLEALTGLEQINLRDNAIQNIDALAQLHQLEIVDLSNNQIARLDPLVELPRLTEIYLAGNQPYSFTPLLAVRALQKLDLPDAAHIDCVDLERFLSEASFVVFSNRRSETCKGAYTSEIGRILALKQAGTDLSGEEEHQLLEYELNQMKRSYQQKYQSSSSSLN